MTSPHRSAARIQIGTTLRRMRQEAGVPRERVGEVLHCTLTKVSNIENAISGIKQAELEKLLDLYGADDETREDLFALNSDAHRRRPKSKIGGPIAPWLRRTGLASVLLLLLATGLYAGRRYISDVRRAAAARPAAGGASRRCGSRTWTG